MKMPKLTLAGESVSHKVWVVETGSVRAGPSLFKP